MEIAVRQKIPSSPVACQELDERYLTAVRTCSLKLPIIPEKHVRGAKTRQVAPETRAQRNEHLKRLRKRRKAGRSQLKGLWLPDAGTRAEMVIRDSCLAPTGSGALRRPISGTGGPIWEANSRRLRPRRRTLGSNVGFLRGDVKKIWVCEIAKPVGS